MYDNKGYVRDYNNIQLDQLNRYQNNDRDRGTSEEITSTSLHQAVKDGKVEEVEMLLKSTAARKSTEVNELDEDNLSPLHYAAKYKHVVIARLLVNNGADVNQGDQDKTTPLHYAASFKQSIPSDENEAGYALQEPVNEQTSIISLLVSAGSDVTSKDIYGLTPLHHAAVGSNGVAVLELLNYENVDVNALDEEQMTPLHLASTRGRTDIADMLIRRNAKLRPSNEQQNTPLHLACLNRHTKIVKLLLSAGYNNNCLGEMLTDKSKDCSPLYLAAWSGEKEIIELFLDYGADVNEVCTETNRPLHAACDSSNLETVKLLLGKKATVNSFNSDKMTPLHKACQKNRHEIVELLLQNGADIEYKDKDGLTPLLTAAKAGHTSNIKVILQYNANISAKDEDERTAISWAAQEQKIDTLQFLLEQREAKDLLDVGDCNRNTALHIASDRGFLDVVKLLLIFKADIYAKNKDQNTPVRLAITNGHVQCILEFVKLDKSFVNNEDDNFNTPLHLAASEGHSMAVKCLIDAGADLRARNIYLQTPLDCAASTGCVECATMLIDANCLIDVTNKNKLTPLHLASKNGHIKMVKLLLEKQADVSLKDKREKNCLDFAVENGHRDVALAIIRHKDWKKAVYSESIDPVTGIRQTPLRKLIKLMPDVAMEVLDSCLIESGKPWHREYSITFNYEILDDMFSKWDSNSNVSGGDYIPFLKDERLSPNAVPYSFDEETLNTNHPLHIMMQSKRDDLLGHPLVTSLLNHKWASYGRIFYYASLLLYLVFLSFYTGFILVSPPPFFALNITANGTVEIWYETGKERWEEGFSEATLFIFGKIGLWIIIALSCLSLLKEVMQMYNHHKKLEYINWENSFEWCIYILAILTVLPLNDTMYADGLVLRYDWQWQCGAFGIFFAWMNLILSIQNFPQLGIYVVMFTDVVKTFLQFCVVFFLFIMAFAMAFYALLMNQEPFHRFRYSLVKTFVMMIGEFDFDAIFHSQDYLMSMELDKASDDFFLTKLFYSGTTYTIFILFAIIMSILTMNLLVGLAVGDIQAVQEEAKLRRFCMQVKVAFYAQKALPMFIWRRSIIRKKKIYPNKRCTGFFQRFRRWFRESDIVLTNALTRKQPNQPGEIQLLAKKQNELLKDIGSIKEQMETIKEMIGDILKNQPSPRSDAVDLTEDHAN